MYVIKFSNPASLSTQNVVFSQDIDFTGTVGDFLRTMRIVWDGDVDGRFRHIKSDGRLHGGRDFM
jgi:hypothetical protein